MKGNGTHFEKVTLNGRLLEDARLEHADLMKGGELVFYVSTKKQKEGDQKSFDEQKAPGSANSGLAERPAWVKRLASNSTQHAISFTLNKQYRTWPLTYGWQGDTLMLTCKETLYKIPRSLVENADHFCWDIPTDGVEYQAKGTFAFISSKALQELQTQGYTVYDNITWRVVEAGDTIHVRADIDRTEMWISLKDELPLVLEMRHNPLGIDWRLDAEPSF
jgi:hypothetical protein